MSAQSDLYFSFTARAQIASNRHNEDRKRPCQLLSFEDKCAISSILAYGGIVGWRDIDGVGHEIGNWQLGMKWKGSGYYRLVWPMGGGMESHPIPLPWLADEEEKSEEEIIADQERRVAQTGEGSCAK